MLVGVRANFFQGVEPSLPEKFFDSACPKNCYANLQNYFARLTPPIHITKNPGFRALFLARQNEFRFFVYLYRVINTKIYFFSFLAGGFCPKNLAFARKIVAICPSLGV